MKNKTVLHIDSDEALRIVVSQYLMEDGYQYYVADRLSGGLEAISKHNPDIVLLGYNLEDSDGTDSIQKIQEVTNAAIIVVSSVTDTTEKIVSLEIGADDYMTKPFEMRELAARIKAVSRRIHAQPQQDNKSQEKLPFLDGWVLDRSQYQLFDHEKKSRKLTTGEFQLLEALVTAENKALSREKLFRLTRDEDYVSHDRAVDIQIARLRKKIGDNTKDPKILKTIRGVGYMYSSKVA